MTRNRITEQDYLKANRKASREEEIAQHGKPLSHSVVHKSKKTYNRNKMKAGMKNLPSFCTTVSSSTLFR